MESLKNSRVKFRIDKELVIRKFSRISNNISGNQGKITLRRLEIYVMRF